MWLIVLVAVVLLAAGCTAEDSLIRSMRQEIRQSTALVMGTLGEGRSFFEDDAIITWYPVTVERSNLRGLPDGTVLRVYRHGGTLPEDPAAGEMTTQLLIVDDMVVLPLAEGKVFLVLRAEGDRLYVEGGLPVENGRISLDHPFRELFQGALLGLPRVS
jgi:hypothetical protein